MLAFAYSECGLTVDQFFALSNYEWSLEVYKAKMKFEKSRAEWESNAVFVRNIMSTIMNSSGRYSRTFDGKDLIKLSFDKDTLPEKEKIIPPEEVEAKFGKFLKSPINGK